MTYEISLKNIKYIPKAQIAVFIIVIILFVLVFSVVLWFSFYLYIILWFYIIFMVISINAIREEVNYPSDKELRELLKLLDSKEIFDYIRELVSIKSISNIKHIGIELDLKFHTNLTEKKGFNAGQIRDDWLYNKIEKLYNKIRNDKRNK